MAKIHYARVNENNELSLPPHFTRELDLAPGDEIRIEPSGHGAHLHPAIHSLKRVRVELTNKCNLSCSTSMRNVWNVEYGPLSGRVESEKEEDPNK